jgi:hypothetical protein
MSRYRGRLGLRRAGLAAWWTVTGDRAARLRRNHRGEVDSAVLYEAMASAERDERLSRKLYAYQIEVETHELALVYEAKGGPRVEAQALAERLMSDEHTALDAMAREELGIDPEKLGGSPAVAAVASFVPFTVGVAVPVLPFASSRDARYGPQYRRQRRWAVPARLDHHAPHPPRRLRSGMRQLAVGLAAAGLTFAIGRLSAWALSERAARHLSTAPISRAARAGPHPVRWRWASPPSRRGGVP